MYGTSKGDHYKSFNAAIDASLLIINYMPQCATHKDWIDIKAKYRLACNFVIERYSVPVYEGVGNFVGYDLCLL